MLYSRAASTVQQRSSYIYIYFVQGKLCMITDVWNATALTCLLLYISVVPDVGPAVAADRQSNGQLENLIVAFLT